MDRSIFDSKRFSSFPIVTLREDPADAEISSDRYLRRAGLIGKLNAGIFAFFPLGTRILQKIKHVIRQEMNRSGAIEIQMPILVDADLWKTTGRWDTMGSELFRLQDRKQHDFLLGPTHEETVTLIVKNLVKSYKDLPVNVYQIQSKFRDEIRPRFSVIRSREFSMKDAYSFHMSEESLNQTYGDMSSCYCRIFDRLSIRYMIVAADSSSMGGSQSEEFIIPSPIGEEEYVYTGQGKGDDYRAERSEVIVDWSETEKRDIQGNKAGEEKTQLEFTDHNFWEQWLRKKNEKQKPVKVPSQNKASKITQREEWNVQVIRVLPKLHVKQLENSLCLVHTPNVHHIDDLANFMHCKPEHILKTLIYEYKQQNNHSSEQDGSDMNYCMACIRGDRQVNERGLSKILNAKEIALVSEETTCSLLGLNGAKDILGSASKNESSHSLKTAMKHPIDIHGFIGPIYTLSKKSKFGIDLMRLQIDPKEEALSWSAVSVPKIRVLFDRSLQTQKKWIVGCNLPNFHIVGFQLPLGSNEKDDDLNVEHNASEFYNDFSLANEGDIPKIFDSPLSTQNRGNDTKKKNLRLNLIHGIELGHLFKLGSKYTKSLSMRIPNSMGSNEYPLMGCYGIGVGRTMAAIIEQNSCSDGFVWPLPISPFRAILICLSKEEMVFQASKKIYEILSREIDILWDDRTVRNGVKLNDAELLGIPYQIRIGNFFMKDKKIEWVYRKMNKGDAQNKELSIQTQKEELTGSLTELIQSLRNLLIQTVKGE